MAKIYLDTTDRKEALAKFLQEVQPFNRFETIKVADALHRVTAKPIMARLSLPMYPVSAMDGITIIANKSFAASDQNPLLLELDKDYVVVDTGDPLPEGFDTVIKIEDLQIVDETKVSIMAPAAPGQYVRPVGEDV
ncbi:MAG: molybdopterin biosynthesis protein, partial [Clostridia bacterium]|nr:molybdopterin biosynthesis protein [Clostridia bacterium]